MSNAPATRDSVQDGDLAPGLTTNGVQDVHPPSKDAHDASPSLQATSPAADSPATPVSTAAVPDVKIDLDYPEQESDARHEPMPIKSIDPIDKPDNSSIVAQISSPLDPASIPIHPPHGTPPPPIGELLEDVKMAELPNHNHTNGINGSSEDVAMIDAGDVQTPATTPGVPPQSSVGSIESNAASPAHNASSDYPGADEDEESKPPPAKRARMQVDVDQPSQTDSATPPPASSNIASNSNTPMPTPDTPMTPAGPSTLSLAQWRFCGSTVRTLKRMKDAAPFLRPVDPIALRIPHYPTIVKTPMDFSTIERKLGSSNPSKPDPNPVNPRYFSAEEFVTDVRLIFQNCLSFNGPEHAVTMMGKRVEEVFDKQIKQMPPAIELKPPAPKKVATPPPPPPPPAAVKKVPPARRGSTSVPVIRRSDTETVGRPKREIHPPPPKDLPYADAPKKRKAKAAKDDGNAEQLKFCGKILQDLHRKQHYAIAHPFYEPVDHIKMELPTYPKIVKKPMDLSTIRKKLDNHEYNTAQKFLDDFKLMIRNCFAFNPPGTPVNQAGVELQRVFDEKWKNLPPLREVSEDEDDEDDDDSEEERQRQRAIAEMENQIETMRGSIAALKGQKPVKEKKKKDKREKPPVASTSKAAKPAKTTSKKKGKKPIADDDVLTFEQKKDLSESIGKLEGGKLERVIQIIHEGVPEIRDSQDEIELEIDQLPAAVLTKLYNFVIRPLRAPATKRNRPSKGTGTGGLKRKSMDEDVEAEKIRQLEERMALFNQNGATAAPSRPAHDSDHSSDSSSGSDSSGSDSE